MIHWLFRKLSPRWVMELDHIADDVCDLSDVVASGDVNLRFVIKRCESLSVELYQYRFNHLTSTFKNVLYIYDRSEEIRLMLDDVMTAAYDTAHKEALVMDYVFSMVNEPSRK